MTEDNEQHLRLLAIFHYVVAALTAIFALIPLIHVAIGWFMLHAPAPQHGEAPPPFLGWIFIIMGSCFIGAGEVFAACVFAAGRFIQLRKRYWFVFIVACVQCCFVPFGTALGVFTIVVLSRPAVKEIFGVGTN